MVAQFLVEMDGVADPPGVVLPGATNRLDRIDPALRHPGRFDLAVEMPLPDAAARRAILRVHTARMPPGADVAGLCRRAGLEALARAGISEPEGVTAADLAIALRAQQEARVWNTE